MSELSQSDVLTRQLRELPAFRALLRGIECRLIRAAGELPGPVLDLGCGDGHFAAIAFSKPPEVGIDPDPGRLAEARARQSHRHLAAAGAEALPFADAHFSTLVANCVLEHIPELERTLSEAFRVLRPGGRLLFGVPSHRFAYMLLGSELLRRLRMHRLGRAYGDWFNRHSRHYHTDAPELWLQRLKHHGFRVEHWEYYLSAAGLRAFDLAHYLSLPRLVSYKLTGRWVISPLPMVTRAYDAWLRPHYEAGPPEIGAYLFFHARKPDGREGPTGESMQ